MPTHIFSTLQLVFFFISLCVINVAEGFVTASIITEDGPVELGTFRSTRFSSFIGTFDGDCSISGTAVFLAPEENPCDRSSIFQDLDGRIVVVSDLPGKQCFEETSYKNLESLGAIVVLNTDPQPPGATKYRMNFGKEIGAGSIPFLDLGLEFLVGVLGPAVATGAPIEVQITGCDDENPFTTCVDLVAPLLCAPASFLLAYLCYKAAKAALNMPKTPGTLPRRFILWNICVACAVVGAFQFLNMITVDGYVWIVNGQIYSGLERIATGVVTSISYYIVTLCGYYWMYLGSRCFHSRVPLGESMIKNYFILNSRKSFFQRVEFKLLIFINIGLLAFTVAVGLRVDADFLLLGDTFFYLDFTFCLLLIVTNYRFVSKATATLRLQTNDVTSKSKVGAINLLSSFWDNLTGRALKRHFVLPFDSFPNEVSRSTMYLTLHLGYWLQFFALAVIILSVVNFFMVERVTSFGRFEDDPIMDNCGYVFPPFLVALIKTIIFYPLIQGIKGPAENVGTLNGRKSMGSKLASGSTHVLQSSFVVSQIPSKAQTLDVAVPRTPEDMRTASSINGVSKLRFVDV